MPKLTTFTESDNYRAAIITKLKQLDLFLETEDYSVLEQWHFVLTAQQMAIILDDMEMLGLTTKLELKKQAIFDIGVDDESGRSIDHSLYLKARQELIDRDTQIQTAMEQCYFSNELLIPDMEKFQKLVEANKQYLLGIGRYQELSNYVDTKAAAKRLFRAVKAIVLKAEQGTDSQPYLCDKTLTA